MKFDLFLLLLLLLCPLFSLSLSFSDLFSIVLHYD